MIKLSAPPIASEHDSKASVTTEERIRVENERYKSSKAARVYYMWLARLFTTVGFVSVGMMCLLTLSLLQAAPQYRVDPVIILKADDSKAIARLEDFDVDMQSKEALLQMFIRQYVELRNTVMTDMLEMQRNWLPTGIIYRYSLPNVFEPFSAEKEPYWELIAQKTLGKE